jgi:Branched-chain amino acid ABC-type transport system, permease components
MDIGYLAQFILSGIMLGIIYATVAVGFTLYFGVLDVINFSHGDVLTVGVFVSLASYLGLQAAGVQSSAILLTIMVVASVASMALLGMIIAKKFVLPLRNSPPFIILLITLMIGTVIRELVRIFYPSGSNPQSFPALLPEGATHWGNLIIRYDSLILIGAGLGVIVLVNLLINRSRIGLAIRAVAQDGETAALMGISLEWVVLLVFGIGSGLAVFAGVMNGLYYNEVNFGTGLMLGIIGFCAAVVGGLGNIYGAILGGFLFALLQTIVVVATPTLSVYKDVFAFGMIILIMIIKPSGLLGEAVSERV